MLVNESSIRMVAASRVQKISLKRNSCCCCGCQQNIQALKGRSSFSFVNHCYSASMSQAWKHRWDHLISLSRSEAIKKILHTGCLLRWFRIQLSKNLKHTHSKASCCVEDNDTFFIICFATSTNSAQHPDAEQDDHVDSVRFLQRFKWIWRSESFSIVVSAKK